jgi:hypothetical protein
MQKTLSLSSYVKKRNGVPLGASGSMRNMLSRSLGAKSFPIFWQYWNPIWGYYLSRNVMKPLNRFLPAWTAIFLTILVSGAIHDLAVSFVNAQPIFFFTPWFGMMGLIVVASNKFNISYGSFAWPIRASINVLMIGVTLGLMYLIESVYFS